jgi:hypothetical protein
MLANQSMFRRIPLPIHVILEACACRVQINMNIATSLVASALN